MTDAFQNRRVGESRSGIHENTGEIRGTFHSQKFSVQPHEMQMKRADQTEIFKTNGRLSEALHFFLSHQLERKLPFHFHKLNFHFNFGLFLGHHCTITYVFRSTNVHDCKIGTNEKKKPFPFDAERLFPELAIENWRIREMQKASKRTSKLVGADIFCYRISCWEYN